MTQEIYMDRREDGTTAGMRGIEGYYVNKGGEVPVRQERFYDVKTDDEAVARARADGLVVPLLLEVILTENQPCTLRAPTFEEAMRISREINAFVEKMGRKK